MPEAIHKELARRAMLKFGTSKSKRAKAYVYGTLNKIENKSGLTSRKKVGS